MLNLKTQYRHNVAERFLKLCNALPEEIYSSNVWSFLLMLAFFFFF